MSALGNTVVVEFCKLCNWTYEIWVTHRTLYDDNADADTMMAGRCGDALSRLNVVGREYLLHQIAKLHDPAIQNGCINLGLRYVIDYGGWDGETLSELNTLYDSLEALASRIRSARNKLLSHNSLEVILKGELLGAFAEDEDCRYFEALQQFVNIVHDKVVGGPYPFNDLARGDARQLLDVLSREEIDESNNGNT